MLRRRLTIVFVVLVLAAIWQPALADGLAGRVQKAYESIESFQTDFAQKLTNAATQEVRDRSGVIQFKKPGLVRWETTAPEREILVVGPEIVWDYFPDEEVAYTYPAGQVFSSKTMLRFISGQAMLEEDFNVTDQGVDDGLAKLRLVPKEPEPSLVLAYLWVEPESALLRRILLVDFFGNGNELELRDMQVNAPLDSEVFTFTPPDGVDVLENPELGG
ncbi:MAG: outer membrane lipoprotein carrier protein LolA [Deltaproteobacteria bacterium]|nr:outer membrane lipoprotein carrier protein LolA [Deltaproteobacteria bacterium]